ncbi:uncharacterized protein (TIGR02246 family) [Stackebrandtia endophytica]|uniref:Uncharacterized protein (TIGR02246 family) n=1 Tax=Stackebrandtia endophytica TaxID=1496996 RepID=A0A543AZ68_9ACTN|nr:nuclear transport factor 2 family protein [Stackebrandtia endophytica]TQL77868.1 uncharacterized protein (TIGR02246 family) [Stackebrandtia endophytica]
MTIEEDRRDVAAVLERYRAGFADLDGAALIDIWDPAYRDPVYIASEEARARRTRQDIADYYNGLARPGDRGVSMTWEDLSVDVLGDVAYAFGRFRFVGERDGPSDRYAVEGRATFVLRRRDSRWWVIHYHESAPGES